ncbi:DUF4198 domain-containing protein [Paenacidovorax monticola]|uniref:DUF4198 domain-containing protein n=1 Tax=Paenacidovorax monticola TaxID=1926868 RepID=A0A7H0HJL1_9BURK|nr:DUF4198 domain-containing protein [Paenacidovorax monticola]QNP60727.1 DUF4198 domain-containing protein [Paenacidovorax monticola]
MRSLHIPFALRAAALLALSATAAQAHQVWIESEGSQARVYFGEYADNIRETSPGLLDKFKGVPALEQRAGGKAQALEGQRTREAFTYATAGAADTLFAEAAYPLIERTKANLPPLLWRPAARWVASLAQPVAASAPLDVVPTGKAGELRVVFQGAPLPKAKVTLVAPSGWAREAEAGADGTVQFELPWKGQYVAEVKHSDKTPGEHRGEKYGEVSYLTTLTFVQASGAASPALPAAPKGH